MQNLILAVSYWLHSVAAVIWIGGITFILFIAIPASMQALGTEAGRLTGEVSKRFTPLANYCIILLVITRIVMTGLNKRFSGFGSFGNTWTLVSTLKHFLVLGMIVIHFYRGLVLTPKIGRTASANEKASLQKLSLNLVKVNFCLGMLVLLSSGFLTVFKRIRQLFTPPSTPSTNSFVKSPKALLPLICFRLRAQALFLHIPCLIHPLS
ncbi:MAG TPA: hypothetical protein DD713_01675 [Nitrospiraceae bacterium]|nr:hypothetical protein [Nitrospiraceae bacterium]